MALNFTMAVLGTGCMKVAFTWQKSVLAKSKKKKTSRARTLGPAEHRNVFELLVSSGRAMIGRDAHFARSLTLARLELTNFVQLVCLIFK